MNDIVTSSASQLEILSI